MTSNYAVVRDSQTPVLTLNQKPNYNIVFYAGDKLIGKLDFNGPKMVFTGEAEESAKVFMDYVAQQFAGRINQAKAEALREAADEFGKRWTQSAKVQQELRRMADDGEASGSVES